MQIPGFEFGKRRVPLVLQTEAAECGLACLAMVAGYHGLRTDLAALRARFALSLKGAKLADLVRVADRLKLTGRPLRLELDELRDLQTPCILHWQMTHFVVLVHADAKGIQVRDPAIGPRRLSYTEADEFFTGIALELAPTMEFETADERRRVSLSALIGNVSGLRRGLGMVLLVALALEGLALLAPALNQMVVDEALVSGDRSMLNVLAFGSALLALTQAALEQARGWSLLYLSTHLNLQWSANIFKHLLHLPTAWFEKRHLGDVVSRFGAADAIQRKLTSGFVAAILDGLMASVTAVFMFAYSPALAAVALAAVALYALLRALAYRPLREASREQLVLAAQGQSCFLETLRAAQAIKLAGRELDRHARWLTLQVETVNRGVRTQKLGLLFGNLHLAVAGLASVLMFRIGGGLVLDGHGFTVGMLMAFTSYAGQLSARTGALIDNAIEFRMLSLHAERLADIVLEPAEEGGEAGRPVSGLAPRIELVDVSFRYSDAEPWVLRHVNLTIEPGESVALAGPSGGGKTTLVKLILGILQPSEGEVRYGGVPLRQLGLAHYRSALAAVMQDDQLLAGSLRENICFFDPAPDEVRIERCARAAAIHEDIKTMPMGYSTLAGDMGATLSGGQKQRLLLARALYKQPKVLLLDEATSHLDVALERAVNAAVAQLALTRIIVAHRPETIASTRRVVALIGGMIVADQRQAGSVQHGLDAT